MGLQRFHCMVLLLLVSSFQVHISSSTAEAGPVPFTKQESKSTKEPIPNP